MAPPCRQAALLLLVASAAPAPAAAQGAIRGLVFDSLLGTPLGGAQVWLRGTERRTVTDAVGRFRIDTVAVSGGCGVVLVWTKYVR